MTDDMWTLEESWWTMGAAEARRRMHPSCVMVFAQGVMQGDAVLAGIDTGQRWEDVQMSGRHTVETEDCVVLAYRAAARRADELFEALCSSTWVRQAEGWQLIQHQQTPVQAV